MWQLERPKPALPSSYFWTWDHSTNWVLDDPGNLTFGCHSAYLKQPETYLEDYRRLTDFAAGLGVKGIVIWGFLRDSHGGVEFAKRVADYAAAKEIAIMPGVGTTHYGGIYYEGEHPYCIDTFLHDHPDAVMIDEKGEPYRASVCPSHPAFRQWMTESLQWLFREFTIGGVNLENGDFMVCHCPKCLAHKAEWSASDPEFFRLQAMSYVPAVQDLAPYLDSQLITLATYTGFAPGKAEDFEQRTADMAQSMFCSHPAMLDQMSPQAITQWTLTGMVRQQQASDPAERPLPLMAYLDNGVPEEAFTCKRWPRDLRPPGTRSVGFLHQGSQWYRDRNALVLSTIKEGCLRAYRAGLEGVSIHGEMTSRHIPWALNYLAFSHFIHWPEDSLRDFGRKTLGQVLGSEDDGEAYAELLALAENGMLSEDQQQAIASRVSNLDWQVEKFTPRSDFRNIDRRQFWHWLQMQAKSGMAEWMRVSNFL